MLFLNYLMTVLPERQIMANIEKVDVDRDYTNLKLTHYTTQFIAIIMHSTLYFCNHDLTHNPYIATKLWDL